MKKGKNLILFLSFFFISHFTIQSQTITGIWRGYFYNVEGDRYKIEMQLNQNGKEVEGVTYSYLSTVFYGKATASGFFEKQSNKFIFQEIKTVDLKMSAGNAACIMKYLLHYSISGNEEFLEGQFSSKFEEDYSPNKKNEDCGPGTVFLRRVVQSDFHIEPSLKRKIEDYAKNKNKTPQSSPTIAKVIKKETIKPTQKSKNKIPVISKAKQPIKTETVKINQRPTKIETRISDTLKKQEIKTAIKTMPVITPEILKLRDNELIKTIVLNNPEVLIKFYDNGEIDDDTISVFLDKKPVLMHKRLSNNPIILNLNNLNDGLEHELIMVADNLGRIPPNTSLMIIEAGDDRYDIHVSTDEKKNARVLLKYKPK